MAGYKKAKITADTVAKLAPGEMVMDTGQPGFGVRRQKGAAIFFVRKHARGSRHFETIGEVGTGGLTVTTAREKAARIIAGLRDGVTPAERRARDRSMPTVAEYAERFLDVHVRAKLKAATLRQYQGAIRDLIAPHLGRVRADQLDPAMVARMHHAGRAAPYAANRALAVLSKMMSLAERDGIRPRGSNPVTGTERFREAKRERYLSSDELVALGAALSSKEAQERHSPYALAAIAFTLLSGMRRSEVLNLRWAEVDLQRGMLFLEDSKTGRKPVVLAAHALELLATLPRHEGSPFVFPSLIDPHRPMPDIKAAWRTVARLAGFDGVRIHDLRHSFASVAAAAGGSLPAIGRLLGHTQAATTQRYAHLAADPVRELANRAGAEIAARLSLPRSTR